MLSANVILENLLTQIDEEGHRILMLGEIIDHRKNQETYIIMPNVYINKKNGKK